jgi:hypothetical protein
MLMPPTLSHRAPTSMRINRISRTTQRICIRASLDRDIAFCGGDSGGFFLTSFSLALYNFGHLSLWQLYASFRPTGPIPYTKGQQDKGDNHSHRYEVFFHHSGSTIRKTRAQMQMGTSRAQNQVILK